jgi:39S ribosomal protein L53/MRP-L53
MDGEAFDARSRAARELLRQVESTRFQKANPKLKIGLDIHSRPDAPTAEFKFVDGTNVSAQ